ncbi:hypothetical protein CkaCkLH20_09767 [Colletotrichum karsti]|uniref:DUF5672 domain-containing protein n=1 Tax=Colletotrichum karsti TaxID=1095194 RepID=A0A9P6HYS4_9PEZI|nr:uncharacterized protein CkaCkLH20_09767 [Colletotrichum karsti]KAF9872904.1 hypothetical protein CkaCkLH20_09767 [Colletotrichum karsti]
MIGRRSACLQLCLVFVIVMMLGVRGSFQSEVGVAHLVNDMTAELIPVFIQNRNEPATEHLARRGLAQSPVGDDFYASDALSAHQPEYPNNVAVIIETDTSRVPNLVPVMLHFATVLGPSWPLVLVTLEATWKPPSSPAFLRLVDSNQIRIKFLPPTTVMTDHHSVSVFLASPWIWEQFKSAHRVLLFQADSILCSKSTSRIEDFIEWDLIGAPIAPQFGQGYNGGLSLRNPKLMYEITTDPNTTLGNDFEDQWFNARVKERNGKLPSAEQAMKFAVETIYYETPLGYHQPLRWQKENIEKMAEWCPEIGLLNSGAHFFHR